MKHKLAKEMYRVVNNPNLAREGKVTPEVKREIEKASKRKKFSKLKKTLGCKCQD